MKQQQTKNEARYMIEPVNNSDGELEYAVKFYPSAYSNWQHIALTTTKEEAYKVIAHRKQGVEIIEG